MSQPSDSGDIQVCERCGAPLPEPRGNAVDLALCDQCTAEYVPAWPFGGAPRDGGLPAPAPEIIMAANGIYWRRYPGSLSMVPTSDDNDPVMSPCAVYRLVGWEDHEGGFHTSPETDRGTDA